MSIPPLPLRPLAGAIAFLVPNFVINAILRGLETAIRDSALSATSFWWVLPTVQNASVLARSAKLTTSECALTAALGDTGTATQSVFLVQLGAGCVLPPPSVRPVFPAIVSKGLAALKI
jgi:hypothetical protein